MPILSIALLSLIGCAPAGPDASLPAIVVCGTNANIGRAVQAKAADELAALPPDSTIGSVIVPDWARMRAENRACKNTGGAKPPAEPTS
jgi:hypothetical protein